VLLCLDLVCSASSVWVLRRRKCDGWAEDKPHLQVSTQALHNAGHRGTARAQVRRCPADEPLWSTVTAAEKAETEAAAKRSSQVIAKPPPNSVGLWYRLALTARVHQGAGSSRERKRRRGGSSVQTVQQAKSQAVDEKRQAARQALCRRYLYQQSSMSPAELDAGRAAIAGIRAEVTASRARAAQSGHSKASSKQQYSPPFLSGKQEEGHGTCKLMAKNIPAEIPVAAIRTHFSKYGNVSSITLSFASSSLGCAVITYADCSSVARAAAAAAAASSA
jgi:hypothetical protein